MAEAAASKVNANPDIAILVARQVDVVVPGADGSELGDRLPAVTLHVALDPGVAVVEELMVDALGIGSTDAKRDHLRDVAGEQGRRVADRREWSVEAGGHVAAADVEADAGDADLLLIGDDATNRLGITEMAIGADHAFDDIADRHAVSHLGDGGLIVLAVDLQGRILKARLLWPQVRDLRTGSLRFAAEVLFTSLIAIEAPRRLATSLANAGVRIDAGSEAKLARACLIGIRSLHSLPSSAGDDPAPGDPGSRRDGP